MTFEMYPGANPAVTRGQHVEVPRSEDAEAQHTIPYRFVVCVITHHTQVPRVEFIRPSDRLLTEDEALDVIRRVGLRHNMGSFVFVEDDIVVRINEREVIVYRISGWSGNTLVRFVIGEL